MNDIFYKDNLYLTRLYKFHIPVNKYGHYIPQNKIIFYYKNQEITQLFKPRIKLYNRITETNKPVNKFYCDTLFITYANITILNIMDFYSRYNYIFIFRKSKQLNSSNAAKSLMDVIDDAKQRGYKINKIVCDNGIEFLVNFKKLCYDQNINIEYVQPGDKNKVASIESLNRTLRGMLERYRIINNVNATNIFNTIRKINNLYNITYHTTLKSVPEKILNRKIDKHVNDKPDKIYKYNVGDTVRIYIKNDMDPFNKLSPLWSKQYI